jgi:2-polyprenyl-3-methyl-5-hydroxy-6-metoxy-1,4-benzoquinol methylase
LAATGAVSDTPCRSNNVIGLTAAPHASWPAQTQPDHTGIPGQYDLVTIIEGLHDMSRPADALRVARGMLREPGCVIVADELVEDEFTAPASIEEQYHYAWSVVACLPAVMGDPDTAATGAVMRPATLRRYALEAGFRDLEVLPVKAECCASTG